MKIRKSNNYFNIKQYFYDTQGNLIFTPQKTMKDYLSNPKIEDEFSIKSCSYYKNIKNLGKNILFIGEYHLTPKDDTIISNFFRNLIHLNYINNSCLNLFIESWFFPENPILEIKDFISINKENFLTNKRIAGFLRFLQIYSNHFQFKGTQFHLTDVRKSYKGIKNFILYLTI